MMQREFLVSRRSFLIGCSVAASPLLTPVSFAAAPGENRLVVIVLRGAMDGLDVVRPLGDPAYLALRPTLARAAMEEALDLDGFFALHPACAGLLPLWRAGELGFAHAVATPYRQGRSHFTGQDLLETGSASETGDLPPGADGWLNRAVGLIAGAGPAMAVTVGPEPMLILEGDAPVKHWLPVAESRLSPQGLALLARLYAADPLFSEGYRQAIQLRQDSETGDPASAAARRGALGGYLAERLNAEARIASFSVGGWDTHQGQARNLSVRLAELTETLLALRAGLGANWGSTLVLAMTEFGRTARENGSGGTDHGTGGALLLAGGALRGKRVLGDWPGLGDGALYRDRDLLPTSDVRAYAGWALRDMFGLSPSQIEAGVFPALSMGADPRLAL